MYNIIISNWATRGREPTIKQGGVFHLKSVDRLKKDKANE